MGEERARIGHRFGATDPSVAQGHVNGRRGDAMEVWDSVSRELRTALGDRNYLAWFDDVEPLTLDGTSLILGVTDAYRRDWLEQKLRPVVDTAFAAAGHPRVTPSYTVEPSESVDYRCDDAPMEHAQAQVITGFNLHYAFSTFIVGSGNQLAHASAMACTDQPGKLYNPLVLHGGVGVGKTHLLQAIGREAVERGHERVLYATSEEFTNELIQAIMQGKTSDFRERYRRVDFLLLDDIQFIAGKESTQVEFFHTFNSLHQSGKQIVVTCDRPPTELKTLEDRLRSRFAWGLLVDIQPPDLETRMAIVRSKAALRGRQVSEAILDLLATRMSKNVRELEGALNRVLARADVLDVEPNMEIARSVLGEEGVRRECCRAADVLQAVSAYYKIKPSELTGPQRDREMTHARQVAMFLLREEAKLSLVEVGNQLGGRNHSTVIYGRNKVVAELKHKGRVRQDVRAIRDLMYGT